MVIHCILAPLLTGIVTTLFPRYGYDQSGTLNSEEEITQITISVFMKKMVVVMSIGKTCLGEAAECVQLTYRNGGESFVFTADEYVCRARGHNDIRLWAG